MRVLIYIFWFLILYSNTSYGQYIGGDDDGFAEARHSVSSTQLYAGGSKDGFGRSYLNVANIELYTGGNQDGFGRSAYTAVISKLYCGGEEDGFTLQNHYTKYIWTGNIGSSWTINGNWLTNQQPSLRHDVIIPDSANIWPAVNIGLLRVGKDPLGLADFVCHSLQIDGGAEMATRINCFIENQGLINVDGLLTVRNSAVGAFKNLFGGEVNISGTLNCKME